MLVNGVGPASTSPYLPRAHRYTALDLTGAMLTCALSRAHGLEIAWTRGDSQALPFRDDAFDYVVLHLIIAVVPRPDRALTEAARVAKPGGTLQFPTNSWRPMRAPLRRMLSPIHTRIATRTDVVFETLLEHATATTGVISDEPQLAGG